MIGKEQSARPYPQIGVPEAHHPLSHHNDVPELDRADVEDQPLSHAAVLEVSGEAARDARRRRLAAGSHDDSVRLGHLEQPRGTRATTCRCWWWAAGRDAQGRPASHDIPDKPSMANLLVTLMDKMDVPVERRRRQHRQAADRYAVGRVGDAASVPAMPGLCLAPACLMGADGWRATTLVVDAARERRRTNPARADPARSERQRSRGGWHDARCTGPAIGTI